MTVRVPLLFLFLFISASAPLVGDDKHAHVAQPGGVDGLEQFKHLAGDWVGKEQGKDGQDVHVRYHVTSGGSAVVETIFPGTEHEMITVIHRDGANLLLTHYCMLGNQPQMQAPAKEQGNTIAFQFVRATNLKSENDMYMHDVTFTFVDKDTLKTQWTHFNEGKATGQVVFDLKRKKTSSAEKTN